VAAGVALMYAPDHWSAWVSDGLAHANLACAMWLVALAIRSHRLANYLDLRADAPLRTSALWCCAGAVLNAVLVVIHFRVWQWQMGF